MATLDDISTGIGTIASSIGADSNRFETKLNNQRFYFDVYFQDCSSLNESNVKAPEGRLVGAVRINPDAVHQLVIEDDLLSWFHKGYMIFQNNFEVLEGVQTDGTKLPIIRRDARDLLIIKIKPVLDDPNPSAVGQGSQSVGNSLNAQLKDEDWSLEFEFVIYDSEDIPHTDPSIKFKKVYFWDLRYQLMSELHIDFSTATMPSNQDPNGKALTGSAIAEVITKANESYGLGKISQLWDKGKDKVFFTAPARYTALDSLNYLLGLHVSEKDSDLCMFTTHRYTKEFQLIPFAKIFEMSTSGNQPGQYQFEHFFLERFAGLNTDSSFGTGLHGIGETLAVPRAPLSEGNSNTSIDVKMFQYSTITNYRFVDMAGVDGSKALTSRPVFSYNFNTGTFHCEYKDHEINNVKKIFKDRYVGHLYGKDKSPLLTLNQSRTKFKNIEPVYSTAPTKDARLNAGLNKTLSAAIYMNECITFDVLGATNRKAGRFIGIDKAEYLEDNAFENKFFGQWFITNVKHVFAKGKYANQMLGVKIHSYQDLKINEAIP